MDALTRANLKMNEPRQEFHVDIRVLSTEATRLYLQASI